MNTANAVDQAGLDEVLHEQNTDSVVLALSDHVDVADGAISAATRAVVRVEEMAFRDRFSANDSDDLRSELDNAGISVRNAARILAPYVTAAAEPTVQQSIPGALAAVSDGFTEPARSLVLGLIEDLRQAINDGGDVTAAATALADAISPTEDSPSET
jgi:hypothetical protein